jgi:hypothetical protein
MRRIFHRAGVYAAFRARIADVVSDASGTSCVERAGPMVVARQRGLMQRPLAGVGRYVYVGWLPLKFFVAPVSRLFFLAREVVEGLTRNVELGIIEGCR